MSQPSKTDTKQDYRYDVYELYVFMTATPVIKVVLGTGTKNPFFSCPLPLVKFR